jgi:hypothetical protein
MKRLLVILTLFYSLTIFGQNGIKGNYFLLLKSNEAISLNTFENSIIEEHKTFKISQKSIFTTDKKTRVAILDTAKSNIILYDIQSSKKTKLTIPYDLKPKTILLNENNLFVGGKMGKEILVQYRIKSNKWEKLEIPEEVLMWGKAVDDLVINDSLLIAIDNLVMPKYVLFYSLKPEGKLELSHFKDLKSNGSYESIHQGRITEKYLGLISNTYSGYVGSTEHITIYNNLEFTSSFAISSNQHDKNYHTFNDFAIIGDRIIIASKEKGLGILKIKDSYFKVHDEYKNKRFNTRVSTSKIKYLAYKNETVLKITIIPNTDIVVLTVQNKKGKTRKEIRKV